MSGSTSKIGGKKVICSHCREIFINFMKKESKQGSCIKLNKVPSRVLQAIGISLRSIERILCEYKKNLSSVSSFSTPLKKRSRKKLKTDIDEFAKAVTQRTINKFHLEHGERPSVKNVLPVLKDKIQFWSLCNYEKCRVLLKIKQNITENF